MKKLYRLYHNIPFAISAAAYFLLAVPASGTGLCMGILLTLVSYLLGVIVSDIWEYVQRNTTKWYWCVSILISALMGLRFDQVWKRSSQLYAIVSCFNINTTVLLSVVGCVLAICAVFFMVTVLTFLLKWPLQFLSDNHFQNEVYPFTRRMRFGIFAVLVLQFAVMCYWGAQKQGFHVDEVYTFELSNYPETVYGDSADAYASWKTGDTFSQILEPAQGHIFDLSIPFWNGETDNHPSTYYILVNFVSSIFKILGLSVDKWAGLIPNIICCLVTTYFFVYLLNKLLKSEGLALAGSAAWVLCIGTINMGIYLRMYALQVMFVVTFSYFHLIFMDCYSKGLSMKKVMILLQIVTIAGVLSQYYFLFFAFFLCGFTCVFLLCKREWKILRCYMLMEILAVVAAELLFPRMIVRLFFGDRGSEALNNMLNGNGYYLKLMTVLDVIDYELFGRYGAVILVVGVVFLVFNIILHKRVIVENKTSLQFVSQILLTLVCYVLIVTKIAPYQVDRYFMCIFPLVVIVAVYALYQGNLLLKEIFPQFQSVITTVFAVVLMLGSMVNTARGEIGYVYLDGAERNDVLAQYVDYPVVAINGDFYNDSILNWAFEFQKYEEVFLCRNNTISDLSIAAENDKLKNGFLMYVHQDPTDTVVLFDQVSEYLEIGNYFEIANTQGCRVFYCTMKQA